MAAIFNAFCTFVNLQMLINKSNVCVICGHIESLDHDDEAMSNDTTNFALPALLLPVAAFIDPTAEANEKVADLMTVPELKEFGIIFVSTVAEIYYPDDKSSGDQSISPIVFFLLIIMSVILGVLASIFIPLNCRALTSFLIIAKDKQPMFLLFGVVHIFCLLDLLIAVTEGVLLWKKIPQVGCKVLGAIRVTIFLSSSLILSTICLFRITAALRPRLYKNYAKRKHILKIISGIVISSILLSIVLIVTETISFEYIGPPKSTGCSPFTVRDMLNYVTSLLIMVTLMVNLFLACTYCVLYFFFRRSVSTSQEVKTMKKGAMFVTSLSTYAYFACYLPSVVVNMFLSIDPDPIMRLNSPYKLILDFVLILLPHLYSCVLPLCLVNGKTLEQVRGAAKANQYSLRKGGLQPQGRLNGSYKVQPGLRD